MRVEKTYKMYEQKENNNDVPIKNKSESNEERRVLGTDSYEKALDISTFMLHADTKVKYNPTALQQFLMEGVILTEEELRVIENFVKEE